MSEPVQARPSRRTLVVLAATLVVVITAVALALWWGGSDDPGTPDPVAASTSATDGTAAPGADDDTPVESDAEASPAASASSDDDASDDGSSPAAPAEADDDDTTYTAEEQPAVAPDEVAEGTDGVTAEVRKVEHVTGEAVASGEISGPAVRLKIRVTNGTDEPLELSQVAVNAYVGPDRAPAGTFVKPGAKPFDGTLAPGESGSGVVLFGMTDEQSREVTVTVDYGADVPALAFEGSFEG